ncbi:MAG: DNA-3-methyladenine glycosylase family protein [Candidatus Marisimplicoccus sp.]|jgi:DNA-3-methyladenine glycosylase II|tara:strand:+ start:472 stop:1089 length:618 start_codon:yes stop_codon:yes gene_type:complete
MILNEVTLKKAYNFLSKDKCLDYLIKRFSEEINISERYDSNYSRALALLIIEQQVSFKAAITIKERFLKIINNLDNLEVLQIHSDDLQSIGISYRKVEYIKNVYEYFQKSNFNFQKSSEDDVIKELTKIRGIGLWSAQMFLIFVLYRINIFSKGDLALMNSLQINYQIDVKNTEHVNKLIDKWSPYKTVASLILWKSIEEKYFYA